MCGIAGLLLAGQPEWRCPAGNDKAGARPLRSMVAVLGHRGPDDQGQVLLHRGPVTIGLGHTRLAILDPSPAGHQPMVEPRTGNWISFNGEIYNYRDLRAQLGEPAQGWTSRSDTEVILQAYAREGRECLARLRGMFALAIWDSQRGELLLARDRLGIKPLYYYSGDGFFLFASELRALLVSGLVPRRLDAAGLRQYLAYQAVPAPRTLIDGIKSLPPGCWLTIRAGELPSQGRYWDLLDDASLEAASASPTQARRRVGGLLREAVRLHLISDVPVAAFLSGGIDSSAIVGLMREMGVVPQTFTVTFAERRYDEASCARAVAEHYQTEHTEIHLDVQEMLDQVPSALTALDQPSGDAVNTYVVAQAVHQAGIKVALSGLGGDELFAGYPSFGRLERLSRPLALWGHVPRPAREWAGWVVHALGGSSAAANKAAAILEGDGSLASAFLPLREVLSELQRDALLEPDWLANVPDWTDPYFPLLATAFASHPDAGVLTCTSYAEARTYMHDVLLRDTDQMSMAHGLEVRVPLLDHELAEYVIGLPDALKATHGLPKRLLIESLNGLLPPNVVNRPKQGFVLPLDAWMRGPLHDFCRDRLGPGRLGGRGIFREKALAELWSAFLAGKPSATWSRVWLLVALEEWLDRQGF